MQQCCMNKNILLSGLLFLGVFGMVLVGSAAAPDAPVVLKADRVFDSVSGKMLDHGIVVVSGAKIQAVGGNATVPNGAKVIDLGDATLMPVFIDAHVHLSFES